jgi:hypothetical protein
MSVTEVVLPYETTPSPAGIEGVLQDIRTLPPERQFGALCPETIIWHPMLPKELTTHDADALIDFAADPESSASRIVRLQAVDVAISTLLVDQTPEGRQRLTELNTILPVRFLDRAPDSLRADVDGPTAMGLVGSIQGKQFRALTAHDPVSLEHIYPDWHMYSGDPIGMPSLQPALGMLLADHLRPEHADKAGRFATLIPFMNEVRSIAGSDDFQNHQVKEALRTGGAHDYARYYGEDYNEKIDALLAYDAPEISDIVVELDKFFVSSQKLANIFPKAYLQGVLEGAQDLVANSLYAVEAHYRNGGHTKTALPLHHKPDALPLELTGDEPLTLLRALNKVITTFDTMKYNDILPAIDIEDKYAIYRSIGPWSQSSVYIRPLGAEIYDAAIEYGRNGEGVEASISFVSDPTLQPGELLEIGKHRRPGPDNRISIRLDREGVRLQDRGSDVQRDPTQEQGTLSLDIGSIIGDDNWLGTKVGRFLAWGNVLRSQALGSEPKLNHVTGYFGEREGHAAYFEVFAKQLGQSFAEKIKENPSSMRQPYFMQFLGRMAHRR